MNMEWTTYTLIRQSEGVSPRDKAQKRPIARVAFPVDTSLEIAALIQKYQRTRRAIPVTFRKLVPWLKIGERAVVLRMALQDSDLKPLHAEIARLLQAA